MISLIIILVAANFVLVTLLVFYIAVMSIRDVRDRGALTGGLKYFGYQILFIGYFVDAFANCIFPVWVIFADWPIRKGEYLVTDRLKRYYGQDSKRGKIACWFCDKIVQLFNKNHCTK